MFKNHPKGLFTLALANMGERFGYYTMLAIFTLYMQAKFGFSEGATASIYGGFLALVYFLPLLGGLLADKVMGYGKTIILGIVVMFAGYAMLAVPMSDTMGKVMMFLALFCISLGTGFFKGNLQALVGNLYDDPKYSANRDVAFSIFYMCINIGAFFAPSAATAISEHVMSGAHLAYNASIPALCHQFLEGTITPDAAKELATFATSQGVTDLTQFANHYIDVLGRSYNWGFGVACISLIISLAVFLIFKKTYAYANKTEKEKAQDIAAGKKDAAPLVELTKQQTKDRLVALGLVFFVVIFFWMAFHQNGLTLTFFARDYTNLNISGLEKIGFSLLTLVPLAIAIYGIINIFQSKVKKGKLISGCVTIVGFLLMVVGYNALPETIEGKPQIFQQFNPFFIVVLTPIIVSIFAALNKRGKEPLAPRKIGIGMLIAPIGFLILVLASIGLPTPDAAKAAGGVSVLHTLVSPNWLIGTYFTLTIAELFLSPMGISFVSKVAPPKYKGLAQGGWFAATAIGNYLVSIIGLLWGGFPLWVLWCILIGLCLISATFLFSQMKKLEKTTREA